MKKVCLLAFSLLIFLLSFNISFAQEITPTPTSLSNYELPHPGLLSANSLYFLKVARDKTVSFLIVDPKRKAEFNLLQADKRLNAGIYLLNSNPNEKKINLAISTISKGENYFEEALERVREAGRQGMDVSDIIGRLKDSSRKHQEEVAKLSQKSAQNFKASFEVQRKRAANFEIEAESLISK